MVDASGLGTVCIRIKHKSDIDALFDALGGDSGLELMRDINLGHGDSLDLIDERKSLALIGDKVVNSGEEALEEIKKQHGLIGPDGKFQKSVKLAFFNMSAVQDSVGSIADNLKKNEAEKQRKEEEAQEAEQARLEAEQDAKDIGNASYYPTARDWVVPESIKEDARKSDSRCVAGGSPQCLETTGETQIKRDKTKPDWRPITRYMVGEPAANGDFKVYVEDPEVVNAQKSCIKVEFLSSSYSVRVETPGLEPLVLGPIECGQLDMGHSSWRLSAGKRLTILLVKARTGAKDPRQHGGSPAAPSSAAAPAGAGAKEGEAESGQGGVAQVLMSLLSFLPVLISFWYFYVYKEQQAVE